MGHRHVPASHPTPLRRNDPSRRTSDPTITDTFRPTDAATSHPPRESPTQWPRRMTSRPRREPCTHDDDTTARPSHPSKRTRPGRKPSCGPGKGSSQAGDGPRRKPGERRRMATNPSSASALAMLTRQPIFAASVPQIHVGPRAADGSILVDDRASNKDSASIRRGSTPSSAPDTAPACGTRGPRGMPIPRRGARASPRPTRPLIPSAPPPGSSPARAPRHAAPAAASSGHRAARLTWTEHAIRMRKRSTHEAYC